MPANKSRRNRSAEQMVKVKGKIRSGDGGGRKGCGLCLQCKQRCERIKRCVLLLRFQILFFSDSITLFISDGDHLRHAVGGFSRQQTRLCFTFDVSSPRGHIMCIIKAYKTWIHVYINLMWTCIIFISWLSSHSCNPITGMNVGNVDFCKLQIINFRFSFLVYVTVLCLWPGYV